MQIFCKPNLGRDCVVYNLFNMIFLFTLLLLPFPSFFSNVMQLSEVITFS